MSALVSNSLRAPTLVNALPSVALNRTSGEPGIWLESHAGVAASEHQSATGRSASGDLEMINSGFEISTDTSPDVPHASALSSTAGSVTQESPATSIESTRKDKRTSPGKSSLTTRRSRRSTPSIEDCLKSSARRQLDQKEPWFGRPRRAAWSESGSPETSVSIVTAASQNILREDCMQFLETGLPRWKKEGLWSNARIVPPTAGKSPFQELELAYSSVCQLDLRLDDDIILNRIALIRLHVEYTKAYNRQAQDCRTSTIGRGSASVIIDAILESIHEEWNSFNDSKKSDLRAKFHNRKRFGKRWLLLTNALGLGIPLLCSSKVANMV